MIDARERDERGNPLREGLAQERGPGPCRLVIFGATGDLTRRKLSPAMYQLARGGWLPADFRFIGFSRRDRSDDDFRAMTREAVDAHSRTGVVDDDVWARLEPNLHYVAGQFDDPAGYRKLGEVLDRIDRDSGVEATRVFYLATPPSWYAGIAGRLAEAGLTRPQERAGGPRLIVEKPFGRDLGTARSLNRLLLSHFTEDRLYRIDHYLGKETVQNILVLRFANGIFEPLWNRQNVDHVQITVSEEIGIEGRGSYFEEAGAIRDMVQNHLLQLLCLVAMEPPSRWDPDAVRNEKVKVLQSILPLTEESASRDAVCGQYTSGWFRGETVPGYREEPGVAPGSQVDTYVALMLRIDNWRWHGVPFYLRCGKRLPKRSTQISVHFRDAPQVLFGGRRGEPDEYGNILVLRIQPDEGLTLRVRSKLPGPQIRLHPVLMDFRYGAAFGTEPAEAYERLLLDAMIGDPTLFTRNDEVELAWNVIDPVLQAWGDPSSAPVHPYAPGTWGPDAGDRLPAREGHEWRRL